MRHVVRRAVAADRSAVAEIVQEAYGPWVEVIGARPAPMDADYDELIVRGWVHVAVVDSDAEGGDPVALIVLIPEAEAVLVENVAVRPRFQGQGIGRELLLFAEAEAGRHGATAVRLYTHEKMKSNIALYAAFGYAETGRQAIERGELVHMRKHLPFIGPASR